VRRIDYRPFHSPEGNFALSWQEDGEWRSSTPSASTASARTVRPPTLLFSDCWTKWRAELHADHPEVSEHFKSDGSWFPRSMFRGRSVECTFDHGVGDGLKISDLRSLKHSDGTHIKRGNHLLVTDRVRTELHLRRQLGIGSLGNLRSYDAWNHETRGEGAHWWVLGGTHVEMESRERQRFYAPTNPYTELTHMVMATHKSGDAVIYRAARIALTRAMMGSAGRSGLVNPHEEVKTNSASLVFPKIEKICCSSGLGKCKHTVFWPTPFGDIRETAWPYRTAPQSNAFQVQQPEWEYKLRPVRGIFTGVVVAEASWGSCKPARAAGFQMWITHSRDDLSVGATLNGKPIIGKIRVGPDFHEYHLRFKPANLRSAGVGTIPKLPVFLDDDPAKWSERFARRPELATAPRLQRIWSFRNACHIFHGPVYLHGGARKKCTCKDGQMCMVFRCSRCGAGAVPLHWNMETAEGHCSTCCPMSLTVSSGGTLHGPIDGSARLVPGSLNQLITLWEGRSRRFLPGDAAPGWAQCLVLGSGLPVYPELLAYTAVRAAHVHDLQDKEQRESIKED